MDAWLPVRRWPIAGRGGRHGLSKRGNRGGSLRQSMRKAGQKRPGVFALLDAKPPLGSLTKAMGIFFSLFKCKAWAGERRPSRGPKASCTGKPSARFPTDLGGLVPIASEPIRRLGFASPPRARPRCGQDETNMRFRVAPCKEEVSTLQKSGSFYFALTRKL
jgi:hypothetical protein